MEEILIRRAERGDVKAIAALIQELANFENMPDGPQINCQTLERDGFDVEHPLFKSYVVVVNANIVGYAIFYYTYSTWNGKAMYLEDIYVRPDYRKLGVGTKLLKVIAKEAQENQCCRLDFAILNWNPARKFYHKKGAVDLTEDEGWHHYRFSKTALNNLADMPDTP